MPKNIVILSIPYQRLIRTHLNSKVLDVISSDAKLVIVSPFANDIAFQQQFNGESIHFVAPPIEADISLFCRTMYILSTVFRLRGFWFRRRKDIPYYWANRNIKYGANGQDYVLPLLGRWVLYILSILGASSKTWRVFDLFHGWVTYDFPALFRIIDGHDVLLIQASSWGFQDATLGYWSRVCKWKSILLPYTTDQLYSNGWLYCNFNKVCIQGEAEYKFATQYHQISDYHLVKLGSLNGFALREEVASYKVRSKKLENEPFAIVYAGSIATFYPTESELRGLDVIVDLVRSSTLTDVKIIYRPNCIDVVEQEKILRRFSGQEYLSVQFPHSGNVGLGSYVDCSPQELLRKHVESIADVDLLVMASYTSLSLDFAFLGLASCVVYLDTQSILAKRNMPLLFNASNQLIGFESVPVSLSISEFQKMLVDLVSNPEKRIKIVNQTLVDWDYCRSDMLKILKNTINTCINS